MPIYGYRCSQCGHELEVLQSMSAEPLRVCPECGGSLTKLLYPVGVQFKGSGFYSTDYKKNGAPSSKKSDGGSSSESSDSGSAKPSSGEGSSSSESNTGSGSTDKKAASATSKE
jgi:putative FmdB family regulatory protein